MTTAPQPTENASGTRVSAVRVFYFTKVKNVGDQINPILVSRLFGLDAVLASQDEEHLLAVGSLMGFANRHSKIWGTGVLHPSVASGDIVAENVYAVRGKLSYQALCDRGLRLRDIPLGDPGILVSKMFAQGPRSDKKYRLGVAAHYVDRMHPWVQNMVQDPDVVDLNVHADPEEFLSNVAACEAVVSSSLHGLIFAEALGVPNVWIKLSDKVLGEGFKFRDWFSLAQAPQREPVLPRDLTIAACMQQASLHGMQVDADGLMENFPALSR
ncbi:MAG TPA: polysaccharide pyruvyl transferase family protein [Pseudolabrys sp.]|jgi:pyruvyltransferase